MISRYLDLVEKAVKVNGIDGRVALISTVILTLSIYISSFDVKLSILIVLFMLLFSRNTIYSLLAAVPFLAIFLFSIFFFGGDFKVLLSIVALISIGSGILYSADPRNILAALVYFKFPEKVVFTLFLSLRMFQLYIKDLKTVSELLSLNKMGKIEYYKKLLKTFVSVAILRAVAISETIYSRDINFKVNVAMDFKLRLKDYALIVFSILILTLDILAFLPFHR